MGHIITTNLNHSAKKLGLVNKSRQKQILFPIDKSSMLKSKKVLREMFITIIFMLIMFNQPSFHSSQQVE